MITFDEFKKLDIRVGKIVDAQEHPDADKLYVLKVDIGGEERQAVAGIKTSYKKEDLPGLLVAAVTNLEPAVIRGVESQAMILAATDDNGITVLTTQKPVKVGSQIK